MRLSAPLLVVALAGLSAACGERPEPPTSVVVEQADGADWRAIASPSDASTLGRLDQAWRLARAEAEEAGFAPRVEALGPLVDPYAGLAEDLPPAPGAYRCRTVRLGSGAPADPAYAASSWGRCTVELTPGGDLWLTAATGAGGSRGRLYPDTDRRLVFLGARTREAGQGDRPDYGHRRRDDRVGVFERIAPARWRLVLPWPRRDAKLEIVELVPRRA